MRCGASSGDDVNDDKHHRVPGLLRASSSHRLARFRLPSTGVVKDDYAPKSIDMQGVILGTGWSGCSRRPRWRGACKSFYVVFISSVFRFTSSLTKLMFRP